ncbi:hypothetical protein Y032_0012g1743 [Ancylostoma ceylanicum]|uniref:Uncharacterized protein n=1 Tax=Ancylostoma ceylanicum TaxID=53326 RepID=A0A016VDS0_9BILA|nr:hypothetical protein Y032_0012g1743 [Ancylostoma ceylanicum]
MRSATSTSQQKANFLICYLDGVAREKIEELSEQDRSDYNAIVAHMKKFFEGPQHLPSATIANRLLSLVRAETTGQDPSSQEERVLEEFFARLRPDIRYCVKLYNPATFEQAAGEAQMVEQLLAEATADRLINPSGAMHTIEVKSAELQPREQTFNEKVTHVVAHSK